MVCIRHIAVYALLVVLVLFCSDACSALTQNDPTANPEVYPWVNAELRGMDGTLLPKMDLSSSYKIFLNFNINLDEPYTDESPSRRLLHLNLPFTAQAIGPRCRYSLPGATTSTLVANWGIFSFVGSDVLVTLGPDENLNSATTLKFACEIPFEPLSTTSNQPLLLGFTYGPPTADKFMPIFQDDVPHVSIASNQITVRRAFQEIEKFILPGADSSSIAELAVIPIDGNTYPVIFDIDLTDPGDYFIYYPAYEAKSLYTVSNIVCPEESNLSLAASWSGSVLKLTVSPIDEDAPPVAYTTQCIADVVAHMMINTKAHTFDVDILDIDAFLVGKILSTSDGLVRIGMDATTDFPIGRIDLRSDNSTYSDSNSGVPDAPFRFSTFFITGIAGDEYSDPFYPVMEDHECLADSGLTYQQAREWNSASIINAYKELEQYTWDIVANTTIPGLFHYVFYKNNVPAALPKGLSCQLSITTDGFGTVGEPASEYSFYAMRIQATNVGSTFTTGGDSSFFAPSTRDQMGNVEIGEIYPVLLPRFVQMTLVEKDLEQAYAIWVQKNATHWEPSYARDYTKPWFYLPLYEPSPTGWFTDELNPEFSPPYPDTGRWTISTENPNQWWAYSHLWINGKLITPRRPANANVKYSRITINRQPAGLTSPDLPYFAFEKPDTTSSTGYSRIGPETNLMVNEPVYLHVHYQENYLIRSSSVVQQKMVPVLDDFAMGGFSGSIELSTVLTLLSQQVRVCDFKYRDAQNVQKSGFLRATITSDTSSQFIIEFFDETNPNTSPTTISGNIRIVDTLDCYIPFTPSRPTTDSVYLMISGTPQFVTASLFLPKISSTGAKMGLQETRPFFLQQINFGNLLVSDLSSRFASATFVYKDAVFRAGVHPVRCLGSKYTSMTQAYAGTFTATSMNRTVLTLTFPPDVVKRIQEDALTSPSMTCSSVPLTIESVGGFDGMQVLGIPTFIPSTISTELPSTYALRIQTKLTPGRASRITFTATITVPGIMLLELPYAVDFLGGKNTAECIVPTSGEVVSDLTYFSSPTGDAIPLAEFEAFETLCAPGTGAWAQSAGNPCQQTYTHFIHFNNLIDYERISDPPTCNFAVQRIYSAPEGTKLTGRLAFPDAATVANKTKLSNYYASVLFPAMGYLPPVTDFKLIVDTNKALQVPAQGEEYIPRDELLISLYNIKIEPDSSTLRVLHYFPLHEIPEGLDASIPRFIYPDCTVLTEQTTTSFTTSSLTTDNAKKDAAFLYFKVITITIVDDNNVEITRYGLEAVFQHPLAIHQRLDCSAKIAYSPSRVKHAQTAIVEGNLGRGDLDGQSLYLPPVTSSYVLEFGNNGEIRIDPSTPTMGSFSFKLTNTGKPGNLINPAISNTAKANNTMHIAMSPIGLLPAANGATFNCNQNGAIIPTAFSRQTGYTLQLQILSLEKDASLEISCTFNAAGIATGVPSTTLVAQLGESDSGVYGVASATLQYNPSSPTQSLGAVIFQVYNDPKIVDNAQVLDRVANLFNMFLLDEFYEDGSGGIPAVQTVITNAKAVIQTKLKINTFKLLRRQAYQHKVINIEDPYTNPAISNEINSFPDISTISVEITDTFTDVDFAALRAAFDYQLPYWTSYKDMQPDNLKVVPFNVNSYAQQRQLPITWSAMYPTRCFTGTLCGQGCGQLCLTEERCQNDFDCESNYCTQNKCQLRNYSIYPENFFTDYNTKKK